MLPYHNKLLVVVWFVLQNCECSVELLGKYRTNYLVRECHLRERELAVGALVDGIREAVGATDDKHKALDT